MILYMVTTIGVDLPVEMSGATTGKYAAKRLAEAQGWDPDNPWYLLLADHEVPRDSWQKVDPDAPVADLDGCAVVLALSGRGR